MTIQDVLDWHEAHLEELVYDEESPTRTDWETLADLLTPTDCSGDAIRTMRHFCGVNTGATFTGNLWDKCELVTTSLDDVAAHNGILPGDLALWHWRGWSLNPGDPFNHVNICAGSDLVYNHGGPGKGPVRQSLKENVSRAQAVRVIRLVPVPAPDPLEEIMSFYATKAEYEAAMLALMKKANAPLVKQVTALTQNAAGGHTLLGAAIMGAQGKTTKEAQAVIADITAREKAGD